MSHLAHFLVQLKTRGCKSAVTASGSLFVEVVEGLFWYIFFCFSIARICDLRKPEKLICYVFDEVKNGLDDVNALD